MTTIVTVHDFVELDYTGSLPDGKVFDTTIKEVAQKNNLYSEKMKYGPATICIGENQILPGLDEQLINKEIGKEYTIHLTAEQAFGKRDVKKIKIVPMSTFRQHQVQPFPGQQIDVDGEMGFVMSVAGGRVIVNFNHPLAGKDVTYTITIRRKIADSAEQIGSFLNTTLRLPQDQINIQVKEGNAEVALPMELPAPFTEAIGKKLAELTGLKTVSFTSNKEKKQ